MGKKKKKKNRPWGRQRREDHWGCILWDQCPKQSHRTLHPWFRSKWYFSFWGFRVRIDRRMSRSRGIENLRQDRRPKANCLNNPKQSQAKMLCVLIRKKPSLHNASHYYLTMGLVMDRVNTRYLSIYIRPEHPCSFSILGLQ